LKTLGFWQLTLLLGQPNRLRTSANEFSGFRDCPVAAEDFPTFGSEDFFAQGAENILCALVKILDVSELDRTGWRYWVQSRVPVVGFAAV
jgi:hypothetical protein